MKNILFALAFSFIILSKTMGQDISSVIRTIPDKLMLRMSDDQKEKLTTLPDDSSEVTVKNLLGGTVERVGISSDYVALKTSDIGMLQIKLLPLINNSNIIGVIRTVCDKACDSQIDFYTTDWQPLQGENLFPDKNKDWFIQSTVDHQSQEFKNIYGALDMTPIKLMFSPDNDSVVAVYDIQKYLSADDYKLLKPYLVDEPISFTWDKVSFRK